MISTTEQSKGTSMKGGFTLVEVIITMGLLTMIVAVGLSAFTFIGQTSASLTNYTQMSTTSRQALETIGRDLRMGFDINSATTTSLDFQLYGKAGATDHIVYEYDDTAHTLYRTINKGTKEIIIEDLSSFKFIYYNLLHKATTMEISIKEVQIEGIIKRGALRISNTNQLISARFMMRNRSVSN